MLEMQKMREQLSASFLDMYLRLQKLDEELKHSAGGIVWKGPKKQYSYWQFYEKGKQFQQYVKKCSLEAVRQLIETLKAKHRKRTILRRSVADMKRALRALRVNWKEVVAKFEEAQAKRQSEAKARAIAKKVAAHKRYADQYKHVTDKGDQVASKSELIIANKLTALGIDYKYEQELVLGGRTFRPDFTIYTKDGRVLYWEHAGMLENPEYQYRHEEKIAFYARHGIRLQDNLIVTRDRNGALEMDEIARTIDYFRLCD